MEENKKTPEQGGGFYRDRIQAFPAELRRPQIQPAVTEKDDIRSEQAHRQSGLLHLV